MTDGAHQGVGAERALGTILSGEDQPTEEEKITPEQMLAQIREAPIESNVSYDGCSLAFARRIQSGDFESDRLVNQILQFINTVDGGRSQTFVLCDDCRAGLQVPQNCSVEVIEESPRSCESCETDPVKKLFWEIGSDVDLANPKFEMAGRVHDWRNHIPLSIMRVWFSLSEEAKMVIFLMAKDSADSEEWD